VYTQEFQLAEVKIGDKSYRCVLQDLQFDPVTDKLIHIDLLELVEDKKVTMTLPDPELAPYSYRLGGNHPRAVSGR